MSMADVLRWILERWPVVGILIIAIVLTWIVAKRVILWTQRLEKTEKAIAGVEDLGSKLDKLSDTLESLPCSNHDKNLARHKDLLSDIGHRLERVDSMGDQLSAVSRWIMKLDPAAIDALAPKFSPRRMTKAGLSLFEKSGAKKALDECAEVFIHQLEEQNPQTPLDVEDGAYIVLMRNLSNPVFNNVKNYIYYQPERITLKNDAGEDIQINISLIVIIRLMSIELRDLYLRAHPEIEINNESGEPRG